MDIIPISPPGAAVAPAVVSQSGTSPVSPNIVSQLIGVAVDPVTVALAITPAATAPDVIDPGTPQPAPSTTAYVEPLPPDYEEFGVSFEYNNDIVAFEPCRLSLNRETSNSKYAYTSDSVYGASSGYVSGLTFMGGAMIVWRRQDDATYRTSAKFTCISPGSTPDFLTISIGCAVDGTGYASALPYVHSDLLSAIVNDPAKWVTLSPDHLGLQKHIFVLNFLNTRLDGRWDLRGHSSLAAVRLYACPSVTRLRLPANGGLEVFVDDYSASTGVAFGHIEFNTAWEEFLAALPDLSGGVGGVIVTETANTKAALDALFAASKAASKNWTLI